MKKILLICNESVTVINFRREIIQFLKKENWDVFVICGDDKYFGKERCKNDLLVQKLHLHAYKIDLSSVYKKKMVVKAKLPDYFKESIKALGLNFKE